MKLVKLSSLQPDDVFITSYFSLTGAYETAVYKVISVNDAAGSVLVTQLYWAPYSARAHGKPPMEMPFTMDVVV